MLFYSRGTETAVVKSGPVLGTVDIRSPLRALLGYERPSGNKLLHRLISEDIGIAATAIGKESHELQ